MQKNQGVTLIEVILVFVIMSFILLLGFQQYLTYRRSADVAQVQSNVDILFGSLAAYFRANCHNKSSPLAKLSPQPTVPISMDTLRSEGFLQANLIESPLVDNADNQGYVLQFNQLQVDGALPTRSQPMSPEGAPPVSVGNLLLWQAQVAVKLADPDTAPQYRDILGASCLSDLAGDVVTPCTSAAAEATQFAVILRSPSLPSAVANSIYSYSMPMVVLFKQMYTTDPILLLTDQTQTKYQYYVCGAEGNL